MPEVSVVIPTFGRPDLLRRAVEGVLAQTMADLEVIVVVDGVDPATKAYLDSVADTRLRAIYNQAQTGAGQARNAGAYAAQGKWVAFLDDDDEWLPEKLEVQLAAAPSEPAILMTLSQVITPNGRFVRPQDPYTNKIPFDEWMFGRKTWLKGGQSFLQTSSLMVRRALFDHLRFSDARQHEEWELVIRATKLLGYKLITVGKVQVLHYADFGQTLSSEAKWRQSLDWADNMGPLLTRKGYSGFCLTTIPRVPAMAGDRSPFWPLLKAAFARGRPTAKQLFAYLLLWAVPYKLRTALRKKR